MQIQIIKMKKRIFQIFINLKIKINLIRIEHIKIVIQIYKCKLLKLIQLRKKKVIKLMKNQMPKKRLEMIKKINNNKFNYKQEK